MVTTRRRAIKSATEQVDEEDSIIFDAPQTPKRKLGSITVEEETYYTPPTSKKARIAKKTTPVADTRPVVEIPVITPPPTSEISELDEAGEPRKILAPLAVRTRNEEPAVVEDPLAYPELPEVEEESPEDSPKETAEDTKLDKEEFDEKDLVVDTAELLDHKIPGFELTQNRREQKPSGRSRNRTTYTMAPLSKHKSTLPDLLPAEFLQDESIISTTELEDSKEQIKPKKTKFVDEVVEKTIKDRRIGNTTYRVTKSRSVHLAPKSSAHSRSMKESWLQGRSGTKGNPQRKPFSSGFFGARK